jgi:hypothetical protein
VPPEKGPKKRQGYSPVNVEWVDSRDDSQFLGGDNDVCPKGWWLEAFDVQLPLRVECGVPVVFVGRLPKRAGMKLGI